MATKKSNGTSITSLFENIEEKGFGELGAEDLRTPRISIVQALSPQRQKTSSDYLADAEEGDLYYSGSNIVVNGDEGVLFLPTYYSKTLVEWGLREKGGGIKGVHPSDSDLLNRCTRDSQGRLITPGGETQLTVTANHYGFALIDDVAQKCVMNMTGSQLKHSRAWNTLIQGTKMKGAKGMFTPPAYSHWYRLSTQVESNDRGSWYSYHITQERVLEESEKDLFAEAEEFAKFASSGALDQLGGPSSSSSSSPALEQSGKKADWED
jgi:hypothetical protein|tara:strand:+ start:27 stop:824 length:798 start_codon:yes stop_codon:yes gene_type:complete